MKKRNKESQKLHLKGQLRTYMQVPIVMAVLLALMDIWIYLVDRRAGLIMLIFVVAYIVIVGALFLRIYGTYDIGRKKSKPIIYSVILATMFTDLVTYLELMIMNTITPNINAFRLTSIEWLLLTMIVQIVVIILYTYAGNVSCSPHGSMRKCSLRSVSARSSFISE